ncbi:hypothetical protein EI983_18690 [Roseovarius faecimaris]|uniref:Mitochondrial inner membrane protein n=1 Tax=Roseovarius faecimaris TaxID=2494550 RepID=A0A6I6ISI0_9RHOB|nr:hypothetical protein [Roseovarius faecimaris]QGY00181.1 hypothetical protein EI983_18690 [Roseovarius faecimaris]
MARKKTSTSKTDAEADAVETAQEVEDQANAAADNGADDGVIDADVIAEEVPEESSEGAKAGADPADTDTEESETAPDEATPADEDIVTPSESSDSGTTYVTAPPAPVHSEPVAERKSGFIPMLLGGLLAGGIGFGAAYVMQPQAGGDLDALRSDMAGRIDAQNAKLAGLSDTVDALPTADTSALEAELGDVNASLGALADRLTGVEDELAALGVRLTEVEKRPMTEGASDAAIAAYERELTALQDAIAAQRSEIENIAAEAMSAEANAEETAQATLRRAAFTRIQTALDTGAGFAAALGDLEAAGVAVPSALTQVATDGAPSLTDLQQSFPDAARAALAASRQDAAANGEESGFSAFLKNQLGTRSLEPREGDDADAVLSRAEAAVREGRLTDALAEIEALPQVGREALTDWTDQVATRQAALAAAEALGQDLN